MYYHIKKIVIAPLYEIFWRSNRMEEILINKESKLSKNKKRILLLSAIFAAIVLVIVIVAVIYSHITNKEEKLEYLPLPELLSEAPDALNGKYDNLTLPSDISLGNIDELNTLSIKWRYVQTREETLNTIIELSSTVNKDPITESDLYRLQQLDENVPSKGYAATYFPDEEDYDGPDDQSPFFCQFVDGIQFELTNFYWFYNAAGYGERFEWYDLRKDDVSDVVYKVDGQDYSAQQAIEFAKTIAEKYKKYYEGFEVVPKYLIVNKNDYNDYYSYIVQFAYMYNGVEMSTDGYNDAVREYVYQDVDLEIRVASPDKLMTIKSRLNNSGVTVNKLDGDFVSLKSALDHTSEVLAENFKQDITNIDIVYIGKQEMEQYVAGQDDFGHDIKFWIDKDDTIDFIPMWRFIVKDISTEGMLMPQFLCIFVDMQTGEMVMLNERSGYFFSENDMKEAKKKGVDITGYILDNNYQGEH